MLQFNFSPFPELRTERLTLRQLVATDSEKIFEIRYNENVSEFLSRPLAKNKGEAEIFIHKINEAISLNTSLYWAIVPEGEKELIGTICLWNLSKENYRGEIGFEMLPSYQRKGFMREALLSVLDYGFNSMKLHSIEGNASPQNIPSIHLMEKNGFKREAYFKENYYDEEKFQDTVVYTIQSAEFNRK